MSDEMKPGFHPNARFGKHVGATPWANRDSRAWGVLVYTQDPTRPPPPADAAASAPVRGVLLDNDGRPAMVVSRSHNRRFWQVTSAKGLWLINIATGGRTCSVRSAYEVMLSVWERGRPEAKAWLAAAQHHQEPDDAGLELARDLHAACRAVMGYT